MKNNVVDLFKKEKELFKTSVKNTSNEEALNIIMSGNTEEVLEIISDYFTCLYESRPENSATKETLNLVVQTLDTFLYLRKGI